MWPAGPQNKARDRNNGDDGSPPHASGAAYSPLHLLASSRIRPPRIQQQGDTGTRWICALLILLILALSAWSAATVSSLRRSLAFERLSKSGSPCSSGGHNSTTAAGEGVSEARQQRDESTPSRAEDHHWPVGSGSEFQPPDDGPSSFVPGAAVWQMFRRGDSCPWIPKDPNNNQIAENDADCNYRKAVWRHAMDSINRCGAPATPTGHLGSAPETSPAAATPPGPFARNEASIGHRGAPLVAPEHSWVGYRVARDSGAGFIECDVSITLDMQFVCRHSTCDLHTTTDILKPGHEQLASRCSTPFRPATEDSDAAVRCCTYDFTLDELRTLNLRMDEVPVPSAESPENYTASPPCWRSNALMDSSQTIVTFREHLRWLKREGLGAIPELKGTADKDLERFLVSSGSSWQELAQMFQHEVLDAGFTNQLVPGSVTWEWQDPHAPKAIMQTFDRRVAEFWKSLNSSLPVLYLYGQAQGPCLPDNCGSETVVRRLAELGVEAMAPPLHELVTTGGNGHRMVPTQHSTFLNGLGVGITTWSLDRSACGGSGGRRSEEYAGPCGVYWTGLEGKSAFEWSDIVLLMYELYFQANVTSAFSDYPAVNSIFLNCVPRMA